jgi:polyvinyl alcohol dehydrogenase (cytochrome)
MILFPVLRGLTLVLAAVSSSPAPAEESPHPNVPVQDAYATNNDRESLPGALVYRTRCQICHEGQVPKAPAKALVQMMTPEAIYGALSSGIMRGQALGLREEDLKEVAEYLSGRPFGAPQPPPTPRCAGKFAHFDSSAPPRLNGWGLTSDNNHFVPESIARLTRDQTRRLRLKWAFAYPTAIRARSQPSFGFGAVFVGSQTGDVYALDAQTGCVRWNFQTNAEVRTAIVLLASARKEVAPLAFFGDVIGHVYAVNALTGQELWRLKADEHPSATITGSPVLDRDTLYVSVSSLEEDVEAPKSCCTFRGSVVAVEARTGKVLWKTYTIDETPREIGRTSSGIEVFGPSGAAVWNTPAIDRRRGVLYVGTGNNYTRPSNDRSDAVIAMDLKSGAIKWTHQLAQDDTWNAGCAMRVDDCPQHPGPDYDIGAGVILAKSRDGRDRLLVGLKSGIALAVDPDHSHETLWSSRVGRGSLQGGIQFGMAFDGRRLYVPISDTSSFYDAASSARENRQGPSRAGLYALDPMSGQAIWSKSALNGCNQVALCDPGILASIAVTPSSVFAGHMDGKLRAYDSRTGQPLWQYDTRQTVNTVSGLEASGGTIGGGGPVPYEGTLYANSGYGLFFHLPGNVLLAFSPDGV